MNHLGNEVTAVAARLARGASQVAEDLQCRATQVWHAAGDGTRRVARQGSTYVRRNPLPTALAALGLGLALGLVLHRRRFAPR